MHRALICMCAVLICIQAPTEVVGLSRVPDHRTQSFLELIRSVATLNKRDKASTGEPTLLANRHTVQPSSSPQDFVKQQNFDRQFFVIRKPRGSRQGSPPIFDVPQIECSPAEDGMERFGCPSPDRMGRYRCIDDHVLCDGFIDCPNAEDEDRMSCMFYKTTKAHVDLIADALLRWARGR